ncbi:hypothetical protein AO498_09722 [Algoriphagus sanaruensis]|uniref:Uncharacterized protein n=1 Tax=Algoriphagus sanaruensis TaxID=1727163 RepID=A0A142ENJ5_9BACT|nr:hypothetical protein AO498_09722 [Algoriphagus sanaruensis]
MAENWVLTGGMPFETTPSLQTGGETKIHFQSF